MESLGGEGMWLSFTLASGFSKSLFFTERMKALHFVEFHQAVMKIMKIYDIKMLYDASRYEDFLL